MKGKIRANEVPAAKSGIIIPCATIPSGIIVLV